MVMSDSARTQLAQSAVLESLRYGYNYMHLDRLTPVVSTGALMGSIVCNLPVERLWKFTIIERVVQRELGRRHKG